MIRRTALSIGEASDFSFSTTDLPGIEVVEKPHHNLSVDMVPVKLAIG